MNRSEIIKRAHDQVPDIDHGILREAIGGCTQAQTAIYEQLASKVTGYFFKSSIPDDEVPDCAQSTWEKVYRKLPEFKIKPGHSFRGYVFTVAGSVVGEYYRKLQKDSSLRASQVTLSAKRPFLNPEEAFEIRELYSAIEGQLHEMTPDRVVAFYSHFIDGNEHKVTAQMISKSEDETRKLASRGVAKVRHALRDAGLY